MFKKISTYYNNITDVKNYIHHDIKDLIKLKDKIKSINYIKLTDSELINKFYNYKKDFKNVNDLNNPNLLIDIYAIVFEVTKRTMQITPYDSQIIAALALNQLNIIEMQTGEGKTLAAVFTACLNSILGKGVHILTFNDYLAKRDCLWMSPIYNFLKIKTAYIIEHTSLEERKCAYRADVTYLTAKESGFDYLKDFLVFDENEIIHRKFNFAIVDEADSILIDEARIPLVIAGTQITENKNSKNLIQILNKLKPNIDFSIEDNGNNIYLTDQGLNTIESLLNCNNLYDKENNDILAKINCSLYANFLLKRDKDYIVRNNKIELIDEFTGRVALKRNWPDNIQNAIEEKEGIKNYEKGKILSSITLQHFINLYPKFSGMTGTASTSSNEFKEFYNLNTIIIPTEKPCIRKDLTHKIFENKSSKYNYLLNEIIKINKTGQPILVGTKSIEESEYLGSLIKDSSLEFTILNAKNDELESEIIAKAGDLNQITISTNMAGRGVDIKLGGLEEKNKNSVIEKGGLYIIGTSLNQNPRIDNQLRGRAGRQGDPGETCFFSSLDDDMLVNFGIEKILKNKKNLDISSKSDTKKYIKIVNTIQKFSDGYNSDIRRQLHNYSSFLEDQRMIMYLKRSEILNNQLKINILDKISKNKKNEYLSKFSIEFLNKLEKKIYLNRINKSWQIYLEHIAYEKEGIHLVSLGNKDPLTEFHKIAISSFNEMLSDLDIEAANEMNELDISSSTPEILLSTIKGPASTWTYFVDDNFGQFKKGSQFFNSVLYMLVSGF
ncbi:MAG: DEAD/DEAH box helicase [Clostridiales bacterium]